MGRKFCETLCRLVEKKGKIPCIKNCEGYIIKSGTDFEIYSEGEESYTHYECTKDKNHRWDAITNSFYENNPIFIEY